MKEIIEERISFIQEEIRELFDEYISVDADYDEDCSIYFRDLDKLISYVEWELENESYTWKDYSERDKKDLTRLLSEYIILKDCK